MCWRGLPSRIVLRLQRIRFAAQKLAKAGFASLGVHVRYGFQFPSSIDRKVLARHVPQGRSVECIFDVGANVGQSALSFARDFPQARIYAFEPFHSIFARLQSNVAREARITPLQRALGSRAEQLRVGFDGDSISQTNRIAPVTDGGHAGDPLTEVIDVETVDEFCRAHSIERIDILKTDTEGYDVEVLRGAARMLEQRRIQLVITEAGFVGDQHHTPFSESYELLRANGFEIAGIYEATYLPDGRCDFCNVVYARG
jgi:FkbM family methyltransferase